MNDIYKCVDESDVPDYIVSAGQLGKLQVMSAIGWITIEAESFSGVKCGCSYRIKE